MIEQLIPIFAIAGIFSIYTLWGIVRYLIDERRAKAASRAERDWAELLVNIEPTETPFMRLMKDKKTNER